jgi:hypothetical protein
VLRNTRKHVRPNFVTVMKRKNVVGPTDPR